MEQHPAGRGVDERPRAGWLTTQRLLFVLACVVLLTPLAGTVLGTETLFFRDVSNLHLPSKWSQAEEWRTGHLPLFDLLRAGGQPSLGNPNLLPLYPSNLLYLTAPTLWAFNAHFWLHLLLLPLAVAWLGRELGLSTLAARWSGLLFAASGFAFSTLNFYNLIAVITVAPAFLAALLRTRRCHTPASFLSLALLWGLLLLAGDPQLAFLALAAALALAVWPVREPTARGTGVGWWSGLFAALLGGILLGLPQHVEFARVLREAYRTEIGYSTAGALVASWDPRQVLEWLLPFVYGRPDQTFWGLSYSGNQQPLFFSLHAGTLVLTAVLASGLPRTRLQRACWLAIGLGLFGALGQHNPVVRTAVDLLGSSMLRLPIKVWLLVALGCSLLAARQLHELTRAEHPIGSRAGRRFTGILAALVVSQLLIMLAMNGPWGFSWLRTRVPPSYGDVRIEQILAGTEQSLRWSLAIGLATLLTVWLVGRRRGGRLTATAMSCLVLAHVLSQVLILRPLAPTDQAELYAQRPPVLDALPGFDLRPPAGVMLGDQYLAFGPGSEAALRYPDQRALWIQRRGFALLFPFVGARWGVHYETNVSPDGLDHYASHLGLQALKGASDDLERLRLLGAWGVRHLILGRRLDAAVPPDWYRSSAAFDSFGAKVGVFELQLAAPPFLLSSDLRPATTLQQARSEILDPVFDPRETLVIGGLGAARSGSVGRILDSRMAPHGPRIEVEVEHDQPGFLLLPRSYQPHYRAWVDGDETTITSANLNRLAVPVPAGRHRVVIDAEQQSKRLVNGLWLGSWLLLAAFAAASRLHPRRQASR